MRTIAVILVGVFISFLPTTQAQTKTYQGSVSIKQNLLEVSNDSLIIDMDVCISYLKVNSYKSLTLFPVIKTENDSLLLDPIIINGVNKHKMYKRQLEFKGEERAKAGAYVVLEANKDLIQVVSYKTSVEYDKWMKDAQFFLVGEVADYHDNPENLYIDKLTDSLF